MHLLNCFFLKLARDFYVVTLPTIVKIQDSPSALPLPVSGHLRIRYRESGGLTPRGEWPLRWRDVDTWEAGDNIMKYSEDRGSGVSMQAWCHMSVVTRLWSPDDWLRHYGHYCHYDPWHQPVIITPSQAYNHRTSDITQANLVTGYWKNIQNNIKYKSLYSLTTSRWDRSNCKKSLILMHFLCFTQLRGAWCGPILYL